MFLKPNDPRFKKVSAEIPQDNIASLEVKQIIKTMLKIIRNEQKTHKKGVGLAAPQIGIFKRIILVDVAANENGPGGDLRIYINPEIIWSSKRKGEWYEGCYSTGQVCGIVFRPTSIKLRALNLQSRFISSNPNRDCEAKFIEEKWTGYIARIFQHEIDHLNGKLFIDHIQNPDHLHWVEKNEFPVYRNQQAWKTWPKKHLLPLVSGRLKKV